MRLSGKHRTRLEVVAWGQGCELNISSSSSLAPAEDPRAACLSRALSPPEEGHWDRISVHRDATAQACTRTHTHTYTHTKSLYVVCGSISERRHISPGG